MTDSMTKPELLQAHPERRALATAKFLFTGTPSATVMVWEWYDSPPELRLLNNDDRDFLILSKGEPHWTYKLAVCDEESFDIGEGFFITITSHS